MIVTNTVAGGGTLSFENTKFVNLGDLNWTYDSGNSRFYTTSITDIDLPASATDVATILCSLYTTSTYGSVNGGSAYYDLRIGGFASGTTKYIDVSNSSYTTGDAFRTAMKGVLLAYKKSS